MARDKHLVGVGFAEQCRELGERLERENPERLRRQEEAARRAENAYEGQHHYVVSVKPLANGAGVEAVTLDHPPLVGQLRVRGRNWQHAAVELRFAYACALVKRRLIPDIDQARAYARKAEFVPSFDTQKIQVVVS